MNNHHYGFFMCECNDVFHSFQGTSLLSSTSSTIGDIRPKGRGTYMYLDNFRRSVSLFCVRSLIKSKWKNSNDVYIGEPK